MERDRLRTVTNWIGNSAKKILNAGFGSADLEAVYFRKGYRSEWHGVDIAPLAVERGLQRFPHAHFKVGDIRKLPYRNDYFDCVTAIEVLEHIRPRDTFKALGEILRVLKPGGRFIVSVPLNEPLEAMVARGENSNAHVRTYSPALLCAELQMAGFTVVSMKTLYAFRNFYALKGLIARILQNRWQPNNLIVLAQKSSSLTSQRH